MEEDQMKYTIIVIAMLLAACLSSQEAQSNNQSHSTTISYIKDTRPEPDLCYASMYLGSYYGVLATVPCEAVEHLIFSNPSKIQK